MKLSKRLLANTWSQYRKSAEENVALWRKGIFRTATARMLGGKDRGQSPFRGRNLPSVRILELGKGCLEALPLPESNPDDLSNWQMRTDQDLGGASTAEVNFGTHVREDGTAVPTVVFSGTIQPLKRPKDDMAANLWKRLTTLASGQMPEESEFVEGYCTMLTPEFNPSLDATEFPILAMSLKTCGRGYIFSLHPGPDKALLGGVLYQGGIGEEEPRPMHELRLPFSSLMETRNGLVTRLQISPPLESIKRFGFGISGPPGEFRLEIEYLDIRTVEEQNRILAAQGLPHDMEHTSETQTKAVAEAKEEVEPKKGSETSAGGDLSSDGYGSTASMVVGCVGLVVVGSLSLFYTVGALRDPNQHSAGSVTLMRPPRQEDRPGYQPPSEAVDQ